MKGLFETFCGAYYEIVNLKWRVYNTKEHNKLITDDYGSLSSELLPELDNAPVKSCKVMTPKKHIRYVAVYVEF